MYIMYLMSGPDGSWGWVAGRDVVIRVEQELTLFYANDVDRTYILY